MNMRALLSSLIGPIGPTMGTNLVVDAFLVVVVGGIGELRGTVIVAFALGVLQSMLEYSTTVSATNAGHIHAPRRRQRSRVSDARSMARG